MLKKKKKGTSKGWVGALKLVLNEQFMRVASVDVRFPGQREQKKWWFFLEPDVVLIVALTKDKHCILNRQWKPGARSYVLEFPVGYLEPSDASIAAAARRELLEETGYHAGRLQKLTTLFVSPTNQPTRLHIFFASDLLLTDKKDIHSVEERIENILVPFTRIAQMIRNGKLSAMASVAAYAAVMSFNLKERVKRNG